MTAQYGPSGVCRADTCRARFQWAETDKGRRMPVDLEPVAEGNVRLRPHVGRPPTAEVLAGAALADARAVGEPLYLSHFATCPARRTFRR